ncbi:hypothetical protein CP988_18000, partial [Enterococcus faecium]
MYLTVNVSPYRTLASRILPMIPAPLIQIFLEFSYLYLTVNVSPYRTLASRILPMIPAPLIQI